MAPTIVLSGIHDVADSPVRRTRHVEACLIRPEPIGPAMPALVRSMLPLLFGPLLVACSGDGQLEPKALPYRLEAVRYFDHPTVAADLDGDGISEFLSFYTFNSPPRYPSVPQHDAVLILRNTGEALDQLNYQGAVLMPHVLDIDADGSREILVPFVRNDSLFVSVASSTAKRLYSFFLAAGEGRDMGTDGTFPWRPAVRAFHAVDTDGDALPELVTVLDGPTAPVFRSILVHRIPDGGLVGTLTVGAAMHRTAVDDFDGDGLPELLSATWTPDNGAVAGGLDDRHAYLLVFRLSPAIELAWSREMASYGAFVDFEYLDFDGDRRREALVLTTPSNDGANAFLELVEPGTWQIVQRRLFSTPRVVGLVTSDLDLDGRPEVVLLGRPPDGRNELLVLDDSLRVERTRRLPISDAGYVHALPDLDSDGVGEILVYGEGRILLFGQNLRPKAVADVGVHNSVQWAPRVVTRGSAMGPDILSVRGPGVAVFRLVANPTAWFWLWGRWLLLGSTLAAAVAVGVLIAGSLHRNRVIHAVHALVAGSAADGVILLRGDGRVIWMNDVARRWLGSSSIAVMSSRDMREVLAGTGDVLTFCTDVLASDPLRFHEREGVVTVDGVELQLRLLAEPLNTRARQGPYIAVRLEDCSGEVELREARTWALVAQRVAHDFRKPLSGIVHELHRLQNEYNRKRQSDAGVLDGHFSEIEQRVLALRGRADELLQVVAGETPRLEEADLNDFVRRAATSLTSRLPGDISLDLHLADDAPLVRLDRRLMESVLSNLVANGIDAMPEGGTITISTNLVRSARLGRRLPPRDYGRLEVLDDGEGLSEEVRRRMFEPGFTTRQSGWGLGLATARRIVENHDGIIEAHGEPDRGSAFIVYLPAVRIAIRPEGRPAVP